MKIRNGWVGNSSSSSFIILIRQPETKEDFESWFGDCGHRSAQEEKIVKSKLNLASITEKLYNENKINQEEAISIIDSIDDSVRRIPDIYIYNQHYDEKVLDIHISNYNIEYTKEKVIDILWNAWNNKGIAKFDKSNLKEDNIRVFNKIENWKEQLENKNSYIYQQIKDDIRYGLDEKLHNQINGRDNQTDEFHKLYYKDLIDTYNLYYDKESFKNLINDLTEQKINYIKSCILEQDDELDCYVITFCTDDGNSTDFDYIGRQGAIFRDTILCIRDENS